MKSDMKLASAVVVILVSAIALHAQPPRDGAASTAPAMTVTGRVLTERGDPIPNARVGPIPQNQGTPVVLTDGLGRFAIAVPAGSYRVVASKTGYARRDVAATASAPIEIRLMRSAAISGRVLDGAGEPIAACASRSNHSNPRRRSRSRPSSPTSAANTGSPD